MPWPTSGTCTTTATTVPKEIHGARLNGGLHYSRSMASYGHFIAASGFEYHGPKGYMAFSPKITPWHFKSAFTAAEGWGSFEQTQKSGRQTNSISLAFGKLRLSTLILTVDAGFAVKKLRATIGGADVKCTYEQKNDAIHIEFDSDIIINNIETLEIVLRS